MDLAKGADVVIFQSEGSVEPSNFFRSTKHFGLPFLASRLWGIPVLSMNQTLYAATGSEQEIVRNIFSSFE